VAISPIEDAVDELVASVEQRVEELAEKAVRAICEEIPAYAAQGDPAFHSDVREHTLRHYRLMLESFTERRILTAEDLLLIRRPAERRVSRGVPPADFLHSFRIGELVLWEAIYELVADDRLRQAALELVPTWSTT
jgi:hypothetical protein